jgi:hypothetical protein
MAEDTSQLQRIADLVTRTSAISRKQRGMRIEAEDWNTVVDILLGILQVDRNQENSVGAQLELRFAPRDHEHLGQVSITWLDPELQSKIQDAGGVSTRQALADMQRLVQTVQADVTNIRTNNDQQQRQLDRAAVDDLDRSKALHDLQDRFDGVANLKTLVGSLSSDVGSLRGNFDQVLQLKSSLTDAAGNAIDISKIQQDVTGLQGLRDSLKGVDGQPLTLREIEVRLTDVANATGVGSNSLQKQLADFQAKIEASTSDSSQKLIATALEGVKGDSAALEGRLNAAIRATAKEVADAGTAETTRQVSALESKQNETMDARLQTATASISDSTLKATSALVDQKLAGVPDMARQAANAAAADVGKSISTDLQGRLSADTATQVKALEDRIQGQLTPLASGVNALKDSIGTQIEAAVQNSSTRLEDSVKQQIASGITALQDQVQATVAGQVSASVTNSLKDLDQRIATALQAKMPELTTLIGQSVTDVTKNLNVDISAEVQRQIGGLNITNLVKDAVNTGVQQATATFTSQLTAQDARLTTLVNNTAITLRSELKSTVDASSVQLKQDVLSSVNTQLANANVGVRTVNTGPVIRGRVG